VIIFGFKPIKLVNTIFYGQFISKNLTLISNFKTTNGLWCQPLNYFRKKQNNFRKKVKIDKKSMEVDYYETKIYEFRE